MKGLLTKIKDQTGVNAPVKNTDAGSVSPRPENDLEPGTQNGDSEGQEIVKLNQTKNFELGFSDLGYIAESSVEPEDSSKPSKTEPIQERPPISDHREHLEQQDTPSLEDDSTYNEPPDPPPEEDMELHQTNLPDSQSVLEDQVQVDSTLSVSKQSKPRAKKRRQKCVIAVKPPKKAQKGPLTAAKRGAVADAIVSSNAEALRGQEKVGGADFSTSQATHPLSSNQKGSVSEKNQSGRGRKRLLATDVDKSKAANLSNSSRSISREETKAASKRGRKSSSALQPGRKRQRESPSSGQQASTLSKSTLADRVSRQPSPLQENDATLEAFAFRPNDETLSVNTDSDGEIDVISIQEPTKLPSTSDERRPPSVGDASGNEQANADYLLPRKKQKRQPSSLTTNKSKKTLDVHGMYMYACVCMCLFTCLWIYKKDFILFIKGRGRGRKKEDGYCVKLWRPKNVHRTRKDLNELDVCMSIYDDVINEMLCVVNELLIDRELPLFIGNLQMMLKLKRC